MASYTNYEEQTGFAFKIDKQQNDIEEAGQNDAMQMKKNIILACELAKNSQIANILKCIDGYGGEQSLFAFLYSLFDDISLAKSLNANSGFKNAFLKEYQEDFINELCEEMAAFLNSSEFNNSSYAAYGRGRVNHLYNLLTKLKLNIKCIEDLVFNNKGMAATNKSLQLHFKLLLKQRLSEYSTALQDVKQANTNQHLTQQDKVKYKEELRVKEPFTKEHLQSKAQQELKAKEMQPEQFKTKNVFDTFKQTTKDFGAEFRQAKDVSPQSKDEQATKDKDKNKDKDKDKGQDEKQKEEDKSKSQGAVCGCGLKVCIKAELERQNPGMTFTRKP